MSKKKTKLYEITPSEASSKSNHFTINISQVNVRNLMHFEIQKKYRANVVESKKRKPVKHKHKIYEEE